MSQETETFEIILGRVENINASHFNCLSFSKASNMVNGINVRLSNMASGYPFSFDGVTWHDSETCKVNDIGTFVGQNNLGKILMICRDCLIQGVGPPIDYNLLETKDIHILGKRISFIH